MILDNNGQGGSPPSPKKNRIGRVLLVIYDISDYIALAIYCSLMCILPLLAIVIGFWLIGSGCL